jgi:hypothetical protein
MIGKSNDATRPVELIDACPRAFAERERAKLVAVESVDRAWSAARLHT